MAVNCVEDFYMAQLHGSHLCTLGERSEGAAIQLTTGGVGPKPSERQRWSIPPQSCMLRPRGPRCAAASERPPVTTRHLWGAMFSLPTVCVCIYVFELHVHVFRCVSMYFFESIYECVHPWFYKKCQCACLLKCACVDEGPTASRAGLWFAKRLPSCPVGKRRGLIFCYRSCVLITWWPAHSVQLSPQNKEAGSAEEDLPLNLKAFVIRFTLFLLLVPVIWEFTRCALKCKSSDNFPCGRHVGTEAADDFLCQTLLQFSARFL